MKKGIFTVTLLMFSLFISGCSFFSGKIDGVKYDVKQGLTYSNLVDKTSQDKLRQYLLNANVAESKIDDFLKDVVDYNTLVAGSGLVDEGFKTIDSFEPEYDFGKIAESAENSAEIGHNCRLTSFRLLDDFISITDPKADDTSMLFADKEVIDNSKIFEGNREKDFYSLFSYISTKDSTDVNEHIKVFENNWKEKGVTFSNDKISLVSVVFHTNNGEPNTSQLFIGHAGLLLKDKSGDFVFLEKLSFTDPYQMDIFKSKQELSDYLMGKYDVDTTGEFSIPFVMENGKLIEGFRANPNKDNNSK